MRALPLLGILLAGCATTQPVTMAEIQLAYWVTTGDPLPLIDPETMGETERRIVGGICLSHRRVSTPLDETAEAFCADVAESLMPET